MKEQLVKVTLYVPCYNVERFIDRTIPAILEQTYPIEEILLINDGSSDQTAARAGRYLVGTRYPVRLINHEKNLGLAPVRNTGVTNCKTPFIASLDGDVRPAPDWLEILMKEMEDPTLVGACGNMIEFYNQAPADHWRSTHMRQWWGETRVVNPSFLRGADNVFFADRLREVGLYEALNRTNGEDVTICHKLKARGYSFSYNPDARCYHLRRDTVKSVLNTFWRWYQYTNWHPVSLLRTIKATMGDIVTRGFFQLLLHDLARLDGRNIPIDLLYPFAGIYYQWRTYFRSRGK